MSEPKSSPLSDDELTDLRKVATAYSMTDRPQWLRLLNEHAELKANQTQDLSELRKAMWALRHCEVEGFWTGGAMHRVVEVARTLVGAPPQTPSTRCTLAGCDCVNSGPSTEKK